jgi:hypothetical protein
MDYRNYTPDYGFQTFSLHFNHTLFESTTLDINATS